MNDILLALLFVVGEFENTFAVFWFGGINEVEKTE
jgi:hypothetical protein